MKSWMGLLAAVGATICSSGHAADRVLTPIMTSDPFAPSEYRLELFDPTLPRSATNPFAVESNLDGPGSILTARLIRSARVADGLIQPLDFPLVVYHKAGRLYRRDLRQDASHERVRVSGLDQVCSINSQALDLARPVNSWVRVRLPGTGGCFAPDRTFRLVRLSMGSDEIGALVTEYQTFVPLLDASGAISSFITATSEDLVAPRLERRNDRFRAPVAIANLDPQDPFVDVRQFDFATVFVSAHVAGTPSRGLYRVEESPGGPVLSPLLHRFEIGEGSINDAASDGQYLYFGDRNRLLRIPMSATSPGQASLLFRAAPSSRFVERIALSSHDSPRIIFRSHELSTDQHTIYSMRKDGAGEAVVLATHDPLGDQYASLIALNGSRVYLSLSDGLHAVQDDGTGSQPVPGYPVLVVRGPFDRDLTSLAVPVAERLLLELPGETDGLSDFRMYDAADARLGCHMASVRESSLVYALELLAAGRTVGLSVYRADGGEDAYVVDLKTCGSLQPMSKREGRNESPVGGY